MTGRVRTAALFTLFAGTTIVAGQNPPPQAQPPQAQTPPAQSQPPAPAQGPTFRVRVDYVEVDVVVSDRQGNLVRDLKKEDFQVMEDGKAQTISTFSLVDIPIERFDRPLYQVDPIVADVKTNEQPFDGRIYVMVIDDYHTNFGRTARVKSAARQFIQRRMGANDLMAVVHTFGATASNQEFTNNKNLLLAAVDKTMGKKLRSATANRTEEYYRQSGIRQQGDPVNDPEDTERGYNARVTLETLRNVADWFASVRGRRKTILFMSEGIDYDIHDLIPNNNSNHRDASTVLNATLDAINAAQRANVSIYGIDPRGLTNLGDETIEIGSFPDDTSLGIGQGSIYNELRLAQDSLRVLSEETGGFAVVNQNDFNNAYDRIVADNSSYYVLAYYPPDARPGRLHKIDVRVSRPGLTVRARKAHMTPKEAKAAPVNAKDVRTPEIKDALDSPLPISGLTMQVFAAPFKGTAPNASVLFGVEMRGRDLRLQNADKLQLSYYAIDAQGKVRGGDTAAITMNLRPETKTRIAEYGVRMLNRMDLPPGRYQMRFAAHDSGGGAVGSVLYDLDVPDFAKAPISMSGIALTSQAGAARPTVRADEQLRGVLPASPVALRTFPQDDEVVLFAEIYDNSASSPHKVDITTTVTTDEGKVMFKTDEERDSSDLGGKSGGYGFTTKIPMKDLAPGPYVLTVAARSRVSPNPSVQRQIRINVAGR
jgi:VWFA-related protein